MSSPPPPPPQLSPDGRFWWDGLAWQPVAPAAATSAAASVPGRLPNRARWILACIACLIVGTICGAGIASSGSSKPTATGATKTVEGPTVTVTVTASAPPPTPAASPINISGQGSKVTEPVQMASGSYRVTWTAQGHDNFIVRAHQGDNNEGLVNEIPPQPATGETVFKSPGGPVYFEVKASTLTWTITFTKI